MRFEVNLAQARAEVGGHPRNIGQQQDQDGINFFRLAKSVHGLDEIFIRGTARQIHRVGKRRDILNPFTDLPAHRRLNSRFKRRHRQPLREAGVHRHRPMAAAPRDNPYPFSDTARITAQRLAEGDHLKLIFGFHNPVLFEDGGKDPVIPREGGGMA